MSETKSEKEQRISILTNAIRNPNLSQIDFSVIMYLQFTIWKRGMRYEFEVLSNEVKFYTNVYENKTLNKSFVNLFKQGYLLQEIGKRQPNIPILFKLNKSKFSIQDRKDDEYFTALPINVMYSLKDGKLNHKEIRFLYYIQSYINPKSKIKSCYAGIDTRMSDELNLSRTTIMALHKELSKKKLISVTKHPLGTSFEYDVDDNLIRSRFNNHYQIRYENIQKL